MFLLAVVGSLFPFLFFPLISPFTRVYSVCLCVCVGVLLFPLINLIVDMPLRLLVVLLLVTMVHILRARE